ncbi:unnamed protein product [Gongylonema pulchrum]|uniref:G_PROTEIN_RECEP_F1_2 domain-containing protein n=1 Tax=Gongylonema pulchrum TaxID=637853 RepID=A0A183CW00_9BILA|nr:unnamed protein product [Gongylonema pulchrum]
MGIIGLTKLILDNFIPSCGVSCDPEFQGLQVSWSTLTLSSIFFAAHLLVCFNSAANPIMYALINRELRQQHIQALIRRRRSLSNATNAALDVLVKHSHHLMECAVPLHCSFDTASYHLNRHRTRKENNSLSPSTVGMRSCSFSTPTMTTGNDGPNVTSSVDQLQSADDTPLHVSFSSIVTDGGHGEQASTNRNFLLIPQIKIESTDSFL